MKTTQDLPYESEETKLHMLKNPEILRMLRAQSYTIKAMIKNLSEENRTQILLDKTLTSQYGLSLYDIKSLIKQIKDDETKIQMAKLYELDKSDFIEILSTLSDATKKRIILENNEELETRYILSILSSFDTNSIIDFIVNQQQFLTSKGIKPFLIIKKMPTVKQLEIVEKIDEIPLLESEKRRIIASLSNKTKSLIDLEKINERYKPLLGIRLSEENLTFGQIILTLDDDFSIYRDLDEIIFVNALKMIKSDADREKLLQLVQVCPNIKIQDNIIIFSSTVDEYIKGEEWVGEVLAGIQPDWSDVQKLAHIDTAIGKRISYAPDYGTEVEKTAGSRALWKIISEGYGVCNGIAQVEQYMLSRIGIESEMIDSKTHTFLMVKNIAIPTAEGIITGNTLVDPTWNLSSSRYGSMPKHFCKNYSEMRKEDINDDGIDEECHKNSELEQYELVNLDVEYLRSVYKSIGICDQEGIFPINAIIEQVKEINEKSPNMKSNISQKFALLKQWCPEFGRCQNSTKTFLKDILLEPNEHFDFRRCITSRVYDKNDPEKQAVLYVYIDSEEMGKQFFYADKESGEFVELSQLEFEARFECYASDLKKIPENKKPWETDVKIKDEKNNHSGKFLAEEGRGHEDI